VVEEPDTLLGRHTAAERAPVRDRDPEVVDRAAPRVDRHHRPRLFVSGAGRGPPPGTDTCPRAGARGVRPRLEERMPIPAGRRVAWSTPSRSLARTRRKCSLPSGLDCSSVIENRLALRPESFEYPIIWRIAGRTYSSVATIAATGFPDAEHGLPREGRTERPARLLRHAPEHLLRRVLEDLLDEVVVPDRDPAVVTIASAPATDFASACSTAARRSGTRGNGIAIARRTGWARTAWCSSRGLPGAGAP